MISVKKLMIKTISSDAEPSDGMIKSFFSNSLANRILWPVLALFSILLVNVFISPGFFVLEIKDGHIFGSLVDILNRAVPIMLLAMGMTLVIATGGIDLSVGSVMAICGATAAYMITHGITSLFVILTACLVLGLMLGLINGILIAYMKIQPFVATLILMVAGRGIAQLITDAQIISFKHAGFEFIGQGFFLGLPFPIILIIIFFGLTYLITRKTALGLFIESVGANANASFFTGINEKGIKLFVYAFSGLCSALAGLVITADIRAADSYNCGLWKELDAILAVVIGGTAMMGGRFFMGTSMIGVLIIQAMVTTILTRGLPVQFTHIVKAIIVILVMMLMSPEFRQMISKKKKRRKND